MICFRMELAKDQELENLKNENKKVDDELSKVCTKWAKDYIKSAFFDSTYSRLLNAGINDVTVSTIY